MRQWERPGRGKLSSQVWEEGADGLLRMKGHLYMPPGLRKEVKEILHNGPIGGHLGIRQTLHRICVQYYWDGMSPEIRAYIRACPVCQMVKPR